MRPLAFLPYLCPLTEKKYQGLIKKVENKSFFSTHCDSSSVPILILRRLNTTKNKKHD